MCTADFKMPNSEKSYSLIISGNVCVKNLVLIENEVFMNVEKVIKHFSEILFSVLGGIQLGVSKHTKTFDWQNVY